MQKQKILVIYEISNLILNTIEKESLMIMERKVLVYDPACPYCRFIGRIVKIFDVKQQLTYYPIRTKRASSLLHEFFEIIPYYFHFIYDDKDLCYTGLKAIPMLLYEIIMGLIWPYGGKPTLSIKELKLRLSQTNS